MPELPEVETVVRGLQKPLQGRKIAKMTLARKNLRLPFPPELARMADIEIMGLSRRAKYILMHLQNGQTLIIHLGMSGRLTVIKNQLRQKHDHMIMTLDNGIDVVLNDPRRFGLVAIAKTKDINAHSLLRHLGPEPFDKKLTPEYLAQKFKNRKTAIKQVIMDQRIVVGVGNIYASEALYLAKINPMRAASTLNLTEVKTLVKAIQKTLFAAIQSGGSSLRDYVQADGTLGYFQHKWAVYGKVGEACKGCKCKTGIVQITQGGRSTFYCPVKQK